MEFSFEDDVKWVPVSLMMTRSRCSATARYLPTWIRLTMASGSPSLTGGVPSM